MNRMATLFPLVIALACTPSLPQSDIPDPFSDVPASATVGDQLFTVLLQAGADTHEAWIWEGAVVKLAWPNTGTGWALVVQSVPGTNGAVVVKASTLVRLSDGSTSVVALDDSQVEMGTLLELPDGYTSLAVRAAYSATHPVVRSEYDCLATADGGSPYLCLQQVPFEARARALVLP